MRDGPSWSRSAHVRLVGAPTSPAIIISGGPVSAERGTRPTACHLNHTRATTRTRIRRCHSMSSMRIDPSLQCHRSSTCGASRPGSPDSPRCPSGQRITFFHGRNMLDVVRALSCTEDRGSESSPSDTPSCARTRCCAPCRQSCVRPRGGRSTPPARRMGGFRMKERVMMIDGHSDGGRVHDEPRETGPTNVLYWRAPMREVGGARLCSPPPPPSLP